MPRVSNHEAPECAAPGLAPSDQPLQPCQQQPNAVAIRLRTKRVRPPHIECDGLRHNAPRPIAAPGLHRSSSQLSPMRSPPEL
jgi:hypothetical protein